MRLTRTTHKLRLQWLRGLITEMSFWTDRDACELTDWRLDGQPIALRSAWPRGLRLLRLEHPAVRVPAEWPLAETGLELVVGGESWLRVIYPSGGVAGFGVDDGHRWFPVQRPDFRLALEAVAYMKGRPMPATCLEVARLVWIDAELERLIRRLRLIEGAARALGEEDDAAMLLVSGAVRAADLLEWPSETGSYVDRAARHEFLRGLWTPPVPAERPASLPAASRASVAAAHAVLDQELAAIRAAHPPRGCVLLTAHAHVDLAWLAPLEEAPRKVQRTFSTVVDALERYPEVTFSQSSAELYELVREIDPDLFERVRALVSEGRWELVGGMWVEPDMNMLAGESIVRQLLHGQRYFERVLGRRARVCWLPDTFGFTPALPQLLCGAGIDAFATTKLNWNDTNRFPFDIFWWEGLAGSRVLAHRFDDYEGVVEPGRLLDVWRETAQRELHPEVLHTVGHEDKGPTIDALEQVRELASFPLLPAASFGNVGAYFDHLRAAEPRVRLPVWVGELYVEAHRGTYTTQGRTKRLHRLAERRLTAAETAGSLCRLMGASTPWADLARPWRLLLDNQFHDVLSGTSISEVHVCAEQQLTEVIDRSEAAIQASLRRLAERLGAGGDEAAALVVNPDLSPRPLRLVLGAPLPGAQEAEDGWLLTGTEAMAGLQVRTVTGVDGVADPARGSRWRLENGFLRVELGTDGRLLSVFDRGAAREVLAEPAHHLWAFVDKPGIHQAWELDPWVLDRGEPLGSPESMELVERGPHRAAIRLRWRYRASTVVQDLRLWASSPRLEFRTRLDWHDRRVLLKARFPLMVRSSVARSETAFGVVERPTHRNTGWDHARFEVPCQRFVDLAEPGYGVALLNDGRYGCHAVGSELGLSLLRSPFDPDPWADEGRHEVTFALLPHRGSWMDGGVLAEAEDLNQPLLSTPCRVRGPADHQPLAVDGLPVGLAALKPAEEGEGLVWRLYEPQGARGAVRLRLPEGWRIASELDLLERVIDGPRFDFAPFQVRSYRLERA